MRTKALAAFLSLLAAAAAAAEAPPPPEPVHDLGNPKRLIIEGAKTFTEKEIKTELNRNFEYLLASHPQAPRTEYFPVLRRLILAGYQNAGFPEAKALVSKDEAGGKTIVKIEEGRRYRCGEIKINGAKQVPADKLVKALTSPRQPPAQPRYSITSAQEIKEQPKSEPPAWEPGKPAAFGSQALKALTSKIENRYADLGYSFPKFRAHVEPDAKTLTAALVIDVENEGAGGTIDQIEIAGLKANTREEVLKFLGLAPGAAYDRGLHDRVYNALMLAGRFAHAEVSFSPPAEEGGKSKLKIEVVEIPGAPGLSQKLSPTEEALLRLRDWLTAFPQRSEDMILAAKFKNDKGVSGEIDVVVSPKGSLFAKVRASGVEHVGEIHYVLLASEKQAGFFSPANGRKFVTPEPANFFDATLGLSYRPDQNAERPFSLWLGCFFDPDGTERGGVKVDLAPAAFLAMAHDEKSKCSLEKGKLIVTGPRGMRIEADAGTGQLHTFFLGRENDDDNIQLSIARGALAERAKALEAATAGDRNYYVKGQGLSSAGRFVIEELLSLAARKGAAEEKKRAMKVLGKAITNKVLEPLDRFSAQLEQDARNKDDRFTIPADAPDLTTPNPMKLLAEVGGRAVLPLAEDLFPRGSWPWTLWRETAFVVCDKGQYTGAEIDRLFRTPKIGPVGCLAAAELLGLAGKPKAAQSFAEKGTTRLSPEGFKMDALALLAPDMPLGQCARNVAEALREMSDEDLAALAAVMPPERGELLKKYAAALRAGKDKPAAEALDAALDLLWKEALKEPVEKRLGKLRSLP